MNQPYVKKFDDNGTLLNPITKDKPYVHQFKSARGKSGPEYVHLHHPTSGKWMGKFKLKGNNRKPCARTGKPRNLKLN